MKQIAIILMTVLACWITAQTPAQGQNRPAAQSLNMADGHLGMAVYEDSLLLADAIRYSIEYLESLPEGTYGMDEKPYVHQMLAAEKLPIRMEDLPLLKKVRSIQVERLGIYSYNYFKCRFSQKEKTVWFQKTSGSQRKSGWMYRLDSKRCMFLGGATVNDDPLKEYGSEGSVAGMMYRIGNGKYIMVFPSEEGFEIYEFAK